MPYYVYILASGKRGTLYVGMTNDIARRLCEDRHPELSPKSFTARYAVNRLFTWRLASSRGMRSRWRSG